jgi:hypothetical protein
VIVNIKDKPWCTLGSSCGSRTGVLLHHWQSNPRRLPQSKIINKKINFISFHNNIHMESQQWILRYVTAVLNQRHMIGIPKIMHVTLLLLFWVQCYFAYRHLVKCNSAKRNFFLIQLPRKKEHIVISCTVSFSWYGLIVSTINTKTYNELKILVPETRKKLLRWTITKYRKNSRWLPNTNFPLFSKYY